MTVSRYCIDGILGPLSRAEHIDGYTSTIVPNDHAKEIK